VEKRGEKMNNKTLGWSFILIGLLAIIIINLVSMRVSNPSGQHIELKISGNQTKTKASRSETITITKNRTDDIIINKNGDYSQYRFTAGVIRDNIPFFIHYNGGSGNKGGWDDYVPPRRLWEKLGWKPTMHPDTLVSVSFSLAPSATMTEAQISYTITRLN
jgi:hypothetical protein